MSEQSPNTGKPSRKPSARLRVLQWLEANQPTIVDLSAARLIAEELSLSPQSLRNSLRSSGWPLAPEVEGVRQDDETQLQRTLTALAGRYEQGGQEVRREIRGLVIAARQHAEWAARSTHAGEERRALKLEMLLWIRTWLENPPLFPRWAELRLRLRNPS